MHTGDISLPTVAGLIFFFGPSMNFVGESVFFYKKNKWDWFRFIISAVTLFLPTCEHDANNGQDWDGRLNANFSDLKSEYIYDTL